MKPTALDITEFVTRYGQFVETCNYCKGDRHVFMEDFGDGDQYPYCECPTCEGNDSYPWGFFLMPPNQVEEVPLQ